MKAPLDEVKARLREITLSAKAFAPMRKRSFMIFLKKHWSTLILIGLVAAWVGISMGTNRCPSCVATDIVKSSFQGSAKESKREAAPQKPKLAAWEAVDSLGQPVSSEQLAGRVSVVVYWATWCGGCKKEIPDLVALRNMFPHEQLEILAISVDEPHKDLAAFAEKVGINYRIARVTPSVDQAFGKVDSIPTLFIIDQEGRIQFRHAGIIAREAMAERVRSLLASPREVAAR